MASRQASITKMSIKGFTLVELCLVMVISGFLLVAALQAYSSYVSKQRQDKIYDDLQTISASITSFKSAQGRYPCPADASLGPNDPNAGVEDCSLMGPSFTSGSCLSTGGMCRAGGRDTDGDGVPDAVLIGAVPYRTIKEGSEQQLKNAKCINVNTGASVACDSDGDNKIDAGVRMISTVSYDSNTQDTSLDPWFFKLTYAVTAAQADPDISNGGTGYGHSAFLPSSGAISIETPAGDSVITPAGSAHYVLVSHGENHMGAFSRTGSQPFPCVTGTTAEYKNCNNGATFVSGIRSMGNNTDYYDDQIAYSVYSMSTLWSFNDALDIYNVNQGNVGVAQANPAQKLQVSGDILADNVSQAQICDNNGTNCWDPNIIASTTGIQCTGTAPAGKVLLPSGIRGGALYCNPVHAVTVPTAASVASKSCPANTILRGINVNGTLNCVTP